MSLNIIGREAIAISESKGFTEATLGDWRDETDRTVPTRLALIHSEVSEALESFRVGNLENFGQELADVVIRTASLARGLGVDLDFAIAIKMLRNRSRPVKHGGKRI